MSTYSTNLGLTLIGTGEQAGTWGTTTNTNLGTLIEQSISGYVTQAVATGTDTTITIPNGTTGVARNMIIELTGTGGASTNLVVPANKKLYFIYNNTSSGQVTVKVSGQTGVSVPNGAKLVLACNGTDVVSITNYMAALSLGAALPVTSGGTGVTTSTGSGNNVLSTSPTITSPTLVTPALGTPASGVMTNVTGLPISTGVSGLGTGVATALAVNVGTAGAPVVNGGALGTPSSGTLTNATGLPISTGVSGLGTGVATALGVAVGSAGAPVVNGGALGTPSSGTLTNATGLPISTGVSGLGTGVATFLGTPSSANLAAAVTDETGSGSLVFATSPTLVTPALGTPTSATLTNATGLPLTTGVTGTLPVANGGTGVTTSTGTGNNVLSTSPTLVTPALGTPASGVMTNVTGLPISTGVSGLGTGVASALAVNVGTAGAPVVNGGVLGTPSSGTLTNATGLPLTSGVTGTLPVANGGTGLTTTPANGALDIGNGSGFTRTTLTAGSGVSISNTSGAITISATGSGGTVTSVTGTSPVASSGGSTPAISLNSAYGDTLNPYASKTANYFLAAPNGSAGVPTFRAIVAADIPTLNQNTTGTAAGLSATLAVVSGGTGVTTSTGTGSVVLSNSPALVTPALGTPASGNLANCTFPTLNQNTTGTAAGLSSTLVVGSGGTGVTTLTGVAYGNGASAFTAATGAQIASAIGSTAVTNATNATNATTAATVSTTVSSGATGTTQSNGDNTTKIATTAYVQNMGLGWGQSWNDVTSSRSAGTTYTNSTGKPIFVTVTFVGVSTAAAPSAYGSLTVDSVEVSRCGFGAGGGGGGQLLTLTAIVPAGSSYYISLVNGMTVVSGYVWAELR